MDTLVQAEQFDAIVGKENTGLSIFTPKHFPVSVDFPPPIAKIMSASFTSDFPLRLRHFHKLPLHRTIKNPVFLNLNLQLLFLFFLLLH